MKLYNSEGKAVTAYKTKRPNMRSASWANDWHTIDGEGLQFWLDRGQGHNYYFLWSGQWYRLNFSDNDVADRETWTLSPPVA